MLCDDVRTLAHADRRRQQARMVVEAIESGHAAHRLAGKLARTSLGMERLADVAVEATIGLMWLGMHLDDFELPIIEGMPPWPSPAAPR